MFTTTLQALLLLALSWLAWKIFQHIFVQTALDNIAGPPSQSFWKGGAKLRVHPLLTCLPPGAFPAIFDPDGWDFQKQMAATCKTWFRGYSLCHPAHSWSSNRWGCYKVQGLVWSMFTVVGYRLRWLFIFFRKIGCISSIPWRCKSSSRSFKFQFGSQGPWKYSLCGRTDMFLNVHRPLSSLSRLLMIYTAIKFYTDWPALC